MNLIGSKVLQYKSLYKDGKEICLVKAHKTERYNDIETDFEDVHWTVEMVAVCGA